MKTEVIDKGFANQVLNVCFSQIYQRTLQVCNKIFWLSPPAFSITMDYVKLFNVYYFIIITLISIVQGIKVAIMK